jgi:hypothetical protein
MSHGANFQIAAPHPIFRIRSVAYAQSYRMYEILRHDHFWPAIIEIDTVPAMLLAEQHESKLTQAQALQ